MKGRLEMVAQSFEHKEKYSLSEWFCTQPDGRPCLSFGGLHCKVF